MTILNDRMQARRIKDEALAERIGCDRSHVTKIRNGQVIPSLPLAIKIAREVGAHVETLFGEQIPDDVRETAQ